MGCRDLAPHVVSQSMVEDIGAGIVRHTCRQSSRYLLILTRPPAVAYCGGKPQKLRGLSALMNLKL